MPMPIFAQPLWLAVGFVACVVTALFFRIMSARKKKKLESFAAPHLLPQLLVNISWYQRRLKQILMLLVVGLLFVALARPQYGSIWIEQRQKGLDILIALDLSRSMLAPDLSPNRLQRAKFAVQDFVAKLEGDRVGLLVFAGTALLVCPLTTDYAAFLSALDMVNVDTLSRGGTDIGEAIRQSTEVLRYDANHKIVILITDGEDLDGTALAAAEQAAQENMIIHSIGVGSPAGELIPLAEGDFVRDEEGNFVRSRLDEQTLQALAQRTAGLYSPLGNLGQGLDRIYEATAALVPPKEYGEYKQKIPIERFPWPLGLALLFLVVDFLLKDRPVRLRLPRIISVGRFRGKRKQALMLLFALYGFASPPPLLASRNPEVLFEAEHYEAAEQLYHQRLQKEGMVPTLHYNLGTTLYKQKKYEQAVQEFSKALMTDDLALQEKSYYNRGNSLYYAGEEIFARQPEQAIQLWQQAQASFEAALKLAPENSKIVHNLEVIRKKLEQMQQTPENNQAEDEEKQEEGADQPPQNEPEEKNGEEAGQGDEEAEQDREGKDEELERTEQSPQEDHEPSKMTAEEAQQLLDSLKDELEMLNVIREEAADPHGVRRDW
jgi:Ca-activated chloride channel homolog